MFSTAGVTDVVSNRSSYRQFNSLFSAHTTLHSRFNFRESTVAEIIDRILLASPPVGLIIIFFILIEYVNRPLLVGADAVGFADSFDAEDAFAEFVDGVGAGYEDSEVAGEYFLVGSDVETADVDIEGCRNHACQFLKDTMTVNTLDTDICKEASGDFVP